MKSLLQRLKPLRAKSQQPQKNQSLQSNDTWLVVGLGNPGPGYQNNRHNIGQMVVDELAKKFGSSFRSHKSGSLVAEYKMVGGGKIVLAKSTSFMNLSGNPVSKLLKFYSLDPTSLVVIHDELDIDFTDIRVKFDGGHAGHNGLRDISAKVGTNYHRVRFGIGRPPGQMPVADYVLKDFSASERKELGALIDEACEKVAQLVES
ncbi:MAG: aminoacyl-tRNA hydrolase [Candidatus Aquiluna sp. XM-24bin5]|nr:MAG: aminoacyl-tRNA hydrolase [Candidatus Aquiluna sp. XM-24bin5]